MDLKTMTPEEAVAAVQAVDDIEVVRATAKDLNIAFSGNSGIDTIKGKIVEFLLSPKEETTIVGPDFGDDEEIEVAKPIPAGPTLEELLEMDPRKEEDASIRRKIIRAKALRLKRVIITNLDSAEQQLDGVMVTVSNKYLGKVSRIVPFGKEWHIEEVLLNKLQNEKFVMRREKKGGDQKFGVKQYDTGFVPKYSIQELEPLSPEELQELATAQRASGAIDK